MPERAECGCRDPIPATNSARTSASHVFQLSALALAGRSAACFAPTDAGVRLLEARDRSAFGVLHSQIFPNAYYSSLDLLARHGSSHDVLVKESDGQIVGYVVVGSDTPSAGEVNFLGVSPEHRNRQYGRELLRAGLSRVLRHARSEFS